MFAEERLQEIVKILNAEGKLKVKELSTKFNVTEDCIRKDLKVLENQGYLKRTYGGAVQVRKSAPDVDILVRNQVNPSSKNLIAQKAFQLLEDRETIFLDLSSTNILLAKLLIQSSKRLTVVTNMLEIVNILRENSNITVICTGGVLNKGLDGFTGASTIEFISKYKFDKTFIGSCGVDVYDRNITTFEIDDGITKAAIMAAGKRNYIVMESSKFYFDGNYKFATIDDIDYIITDELTNEEIKNILSEANIQLI